MFSKDTSSLKPNCREKCLKYRDKRSNVKVEERGKSIVFENADKMEVICYRVDGGIIGQDSCRCDNLIMFIEGRQAFFIELKGVDVRDALKQIASAVNLLRKDLMEFDWHGRVVASSGIPNITSEPKYINLLRDLKRHNPNATLIVKKGKIMFSYSTEGPMTYTVDSTLKWRKIP